MDQLTIDEVIDGLNDLINEVDDITSFQVQIVEEAILLLEDARDRANGF